MRCVPAHDFNVSKAMAWRSAIADDPPYQRESSIWSLAKQQLFIDSLLNGYDVPKIYLHDLRGKHPTRVYAVVDGKQRLTTIWRYLTDEFPLADDFTIEPANLPDVPDDAPHPRSGQRFSELDPSWQQVLRTTHLAVVLIQNATEADIEDLFSRLNNGEPLNAAEKRNAMGGDATKLVRAVASHRFFRERVRFTNARFRHQDAAARLLVLEAAALDGAGGLPDLRSRSLDAFIRDNRRMSATRRHELRDCVTDVLNRMCQVFEVHDPLLANQSALPLHYLVVRAVVDQQRGCQTAAMLRKELAAFGEERRGQLQRTDEEQDPELREFNALIQSSANEPRSLARRRAILFDRIRRARPALAGLLPEDGDGATPADAPSGSAGRSHVHSQA